MALSSGSMKVCFNSVCKEPLKTPRQGWRCRTGDFADLCDRCAFAYDEEKFCDIYHSSASGWRCCESCGKKVHCGCIVSFHMFILLDAGEIECIDCAKKDYLLTPNPAWPSGSRFFLERNVVAKNWGSIAGSGPVPWHQAPNLFNSSKVQPELQSRMPIQIEMPSSIDGILARHPVSASPQAKTTSKDLSARPETGSLQIVASEITVDRPSGIHGNLSGNVSNQSSFFNNEIPTPLASLPPINMEKDQRNNQEKVSEIHVKERTPPASVGKQVLNDKGIESSVEAHTGNGKPRGEKRGRNQLLPQKRTPPASVGKQISNDTVIKSSVEAHTSNGKPRDETRGWNQLLPQERTPPASVGKQVSNDKGIESSVEAHTSNGKPRGETRGRNQLLPQERTPPASVGKQVSNDKGIESSVEAHTSNGKPRGETRGRNQLVPRYSPRLTNEELQQISGDPNAKITPLFEKVLTASDAGRIGRLVLPKKCAEAYLPPISEPEGLPLMLQDLTGKDWKLQFRYWPNNNSRMYVLEGITPCIQSMQLQAGDTVTFSRLEPEGKLVMGFRKASMASPPDQGRSTDQASGVTEIDKSAYIAKEVVGAKVSVRAKRKKGSKMGKNKRHKLDNNERIEVTFTLGEVQDLLRPPPKCTPAVLLIEGIEFEGYQDGPCVGRPTVSATNLNGDTIQWVQCEDCFKWREVPADALLPSSWTCSKNSWDPERSSCSAKEELTPKQLQNMLPMISQASSSKKKATIIDLEELDPDEGLDALELTKATLASTQATLASTQATTKHPRHRPGCTCIVCMQPPSGTKHKTGCMCNACMTLVRRFQTLSSRRGQKQSEKEAENARQKPTQTPDDDVIMLPETENGDSNKKMKIVEGSDGDLNAKKSAHLTFKNRVIDLNVQPDREDESPPVSDFMGMTRLIQESIRQMSSSNGVGGRYENGIPLDPNI